VDDGVELTITQASGGRPPHLAEEVNLLHRTHNRDEASKNQNEGNSSPSADARAVSYFFLVILHFPLVCCLLPGIVWYRLMEIEVPRPLTVLGNQDPCTESTKRSKGLPAFRRHLNGFFEDPCLRGDGGIRTLGGDLADLCL
jgi:hypothetical protein